MPSAASAKLEKQSSGNQTVDTSNDNNNSSSTSSINNTPIRQALIIIEHKIRNLEKRKTKLESYRTIQLSGKELSPDQKAAVSKYDEVAQSLEFARELSKQMLQLATTAEKEQKKQARREIAFRAQAETAKIREVLTIQNILTCFSSNVQIREDFLNGTNGAVKLEEDDLKILEKFHADIEVKRQTAPEDVPFSTVAQKAAEYLSLTIDGRPKQYNETTFDNVRRILTSIQESGYLDRYGKTTTENDNDEDDDGAGDNGNEELPTADDELINDQSILEDGISKVSKHDNSIHDNVERDGSEIGNSNISQQLQTLQQQSQSMSSPSVSAITQAIDVPQFSTEAPSAAAVPAPSFPQQPQQQQQSSQPTSIVSTQIPTQPPPSQMPIPVVPTQIASVAQAAQVASGPSTVVQPNPAAAAANPLHFPPTTVRAVEQAYFKQHQYIQQMRPLADIIASGNFVFLQESELDSPDVNPATGFTTNEGQNQGSTAVNSNATASLTNQSSLSQQQHQPGQTQSQQQTQQLSTISQTVGISQKQQQQSQQVPSVPPISAAPIPTQTFTNQSFPPIVPPPTAMFPQGVQNPNEISNSPSQMPVFAAGPLPIPLTPAAVAQQQPIVVSVATPSIGNINVSQNSATVLKSVETQQQQQQQGIITNQQSPLITGPSGASVPLPGFTSVVSSKFPSASAPSIVGTHQVTVQKTQETYEKLQKSSQSKNMSVLSEHQIHHHHHKKVDDIKDRLNENSNDWDSNENLPKPQRMSKKEDESNQWSNDVVVTNNVKTNEWNNSSYDNQTVVVETNNWNSNNQNDGSGGGGGSYGSRTRSNFGNRPGGSGGGNRGIRNSGSGAGNGGPGGPQSNGYRGGRSNNSYQQQQQGSRTSGMYFRNNNENTTGGGGGGSSGGGGGSGYYQNHQNNGYNSSGGGTGKQDGGTPGGNNNYGGGTMNTGYRPRGGPLTSSNRQQQSGNGSGNRGTSNSGGGGGGGPLPQRPMNPRTPSNSGNNAIGGGGGSGGGGIAGNPNRSAAGNSGGNRTTSNYRPPHVRQQHQHQQQQQQQDVNV